MDSLVIIAGNGEFLNWMSENFEKLEQKIRTCNKHQPNNNDFSESIELEIPNNTPTPGEPLNECEKEKESKVEQKKNEKKEEEKDELEETLSCSSGVLTSGGMLPPPPQELDL